MYFHPLRLLSVLSISTSVAIALMRSQSNGRKVESLKISIPRSTVGWVKWGGKAQMLAGGMGTSFGWYRYLDPRGSWEEEWQTWSVQDETDYVTDDTWVKPEVQERAEGVVDWKALEGNYLLAEQRFNVFGPNKKAGTRNSEEDLRKQLELLGDAEKKKEKQKTSKEPQRAEELGPSGQTSNTGIDDYQALLKSMEEENKARLRKI